MSKAKSNPARSAQVEQSLRLSEERYRALVEGANVGIAQIDSAHQIATINKKLCEMFGKSPGELIGQKCFRAFEGRETACGNCPGFRAMATGKPAEVERILQKDDGSRLVLRIQASPVLDQQGEPQAFIEVVEDITERKRLEEVIRAVSSRHEAILVAVPDILMEVDLNKVYTWANEAGFEFFGPDVLGQEAAYYFVGDQQTYEAVQPLFEGRENFVHLESWQRRKDGEKRLLSWRCRALRDREGKVTGVLSSARDVTARKGAEESLRRAKEAAEAANRAKSEFLANMSHEIRTPMTAILGFADLLMTPNLPCGEQREFLDAIRRNGSALLELISDILDLSRIEADKLPLEKIDCSLQQMVDDAMSVVRAAAIGKGLSLEVDYVYPLPERICTDPARLRQILVNLLGNAVKFTECGGVRLMLRCLSGVGRSMRMQFAVADTGIGISPQKIGKLFQAFTQADASLTRRYGGTGLGLAIAKRLAKALGGDIEVSSQLGQGSTFTLAIDVGPLEGAAVLRAPRAPQGTVPILRGASDAPSANDVFAAKNGTVPLSAPAIKGRVLLAEDVADVYLLLARILRDMQLEVDIATDGRAACSMAQQSEAEGKPYDLILMDIQMPVMDGYQATRWLRQRDWQGPIVAVTARATVEDRERCLAAGCDDYIAKPITADGLREMLARYLELAESGARASCPHPAETGARASCPHLAETGARASCPPGTARWRGMASTHTPRRRVAAETAALPAALPSELPGLLEGGLLEAAKVAELLEAFRGGLPARLSDIEEAMCQRDLQRLQEAAHELKGTAGIFGFTQVSAAADVIHQRASETEDLQQLEAAVAELVELCRQAVGQAFQPDENRHKSG